MLTRNLSGALAQLLGFMGLLANNLIIPKLLGLNAYGEIATLLSMPYFAQGLVDSALFAFVVHEFAFPHTRNARLRGLIPIVAIYFFGAGVIIGIYGIAIGVPVFTLTLLFAIDSAIALYTILLSVTLGSANSRAILRNSVIFSLLLTVLPLVFSSILGKTPLGVLWAVFVAYGLADISLWRNAHPIVADVFVSKSYPSTLRIFVMAKKIGLLCGSRLLFVTFNTLIVILFARHAESQSVAMYKLALSADMALIYSVPLHPNIFQATLWHTKSKLRTAFLWLAGVWIVGGAFALYFLLPNLLAYLFKGQKIDLGAMRLIPLLTPLLYLVWMTPTLLIGRIPTKHLFRISLIAVFILLFSFFVLPHLMAADYALLLAMTLSLGGYSILLLLKIQSQRALSKTRPAKDGINGASTEKNRAS
ncbi:MAG: hypothetical protein HY014_12415 [Acidobacteria bacterium]|nr:hypothetical protein [Acidobacteriota bacterium]MBI3488960.1 hypothetical protein [Acidobacteriota bacterium]